MAGSAHPAAQAYIADSTSEARRTQAIGLIGAAFGIGTVAGPGAAALLSAYGLVTPIFVISAAVFAAWIFALRSVRRLPESPSGGARRFFFPRRTLKLLAIGALLFSMMAAIQQATGFRVQDTQDATAEETAQLAGLALSGAAIAAVLAQAGLIQVLRWSPKRLLLLGAFAGSAGGVVLALSAEYGTIVLGVSLMGLAFGLMNPAYTAGLTLTATAAEQGSVAGLNGMVQGVGYVAGPLIGGGLYQVAPTLPFTTCAILMAIALMIAIPLKIGR
jgi:MFS family permease